MRTIEYDRVKLVTSSLFQLLICPVLGLVLVPRGGLFALLGLFLIIGGPVMALGTLRRLFGDATAIRYDDNKITVCTTWSSKTWSWAEIQSVDLMQRTMRMYGIIPIRRIYSLSVKGGNGSAFGAKTMQVPLALLGMNKEDGARLVRDLTEASMSPRRAATFGDGSMGARPAARLPAQAMPDPAPSDGDFDPDAVMARYMARRSSEPAPAAAAPAPQLTPHQARVTGFGRRGL